MRDLIVGGELGEVARISWTITDGFRTCTYYASGGWRAIWPVDLAASYAEP